MSSLGALIVVVAAAIGSFFVGSEPETILLMVCAVVTSLVCFDRSMDRNLRSRFAWALASLAPVAKTVPVVVHELFADETRLVERYDHIGSLLFGLCLLIAVVSLSRPATRCGFKLAGFDATVIAGTAATAAVSGASVAYLYDRDFGSQLASRLIETPTWFVIGGLLAAATIAISHVPSASRSLVGYLVIVCATAALLAVTVAGADLARGWWALLFAGLTASATVLGPAALGERHARDRLSMVGVVVALLVGLIAAAAAISARSDPGAWAPAWLLLGALSLVMFALGLMSRPTDPSQLPPDGFGGSQDIGVAPAAPQSDSQEVRDQVLATQAALQALRAARVAASPAAAAEPTSTSTTFADAAAERLDVADGRTRVPQPIVVPRMEPAAQQGVPPSAEEAAPADSTADSQPLTHEPASSESQGLSSAGLVAVARSAAEIRQAPSEKRHALAPLDQAHRFDPSTGLLSAAGLQHALKSAFATSRQARHISIMLFTVRDLDEIEQQYGRLASAAVTREMADRIRRLLPEGTGARFARAAYAVILVGEVGSGEWVAERLARVLLQLRAPIDDGEVGEKIDVVAGMAQCYDDEDAASFVKRANLGLARAVQTVEPTLVAMP